MSLRTFGQRSYAARTFNARTWGGVEEAVAGVPSSGWVAETRARLAVAETRDRVMISNPRNRVWIARDK